MDEHTILDGSALKGEIRNCVSSLEQQNSNLKNMSACFNSMMNNYSIQGEAAESIRATAAYYAEIVDTNIVLNEMDIADLKKADRAIPYEYFEGFTIALNLREISRKWYIAVDKQEEAFQNMQNATSEKMQEFYSQEFKKYTQEIADLAKELKIWQDKKGRLEKAEIATKWLFTGSNRVRGALRSGVKGITTTVNGRHYSVQIRSNGWRQAAMAGLKQAVNVRSGNYEAIKYDETKIDSDSELVEYLDQYDYLQESIKNYPNSIMVQIWKDRSEQIDSMFEDYYKNVLINAKHSEQFTVAAYYMRDELDYSNRNLAVIANYWNSIDGYESIKGIEMPKSWCDAKLVLPADMQITDKNVLDAGLDENLRKWYHEGFYVVELMSGQPYAPNPTDYKEFGKDSYEFDSKGNIIYTYDPDRVYLLSDSQYLDWYDYTFGGMIDYAAEKDSIRANKYYLETYVFETDLSRTLDYYHTFTNENTTVYQNEIQAFVYGIGKADEYYDKVWKQKIDQTKAIGQYVKNDYKIIGLRDYPDVIDMIKSEINSHTYDVLGCTDYVDINHLAKTLPDKMRGIGEIDENGIIVDGNTLRIRFSGGEDGFGNVYPPQEYEFKFGETVNCFGATMVNSEDFYKVAGQIAEYQVKQRNFDTNMEMYDGQAITTLFLAGRISESDFYGLSQNQQQSYIDLVETEMIRNEMLQAYVWADVRDIEVVNDYWEILKFTLSTELDLLGMFTGVSAFSIAKSGLTFADSVIKYGMGEKKEAVKNIAEEAGSIVWDKFKDVSLENAPDVLKDLNDKKDMFDNGKTYISDGIEGFNQFTYDAVDPLANYSNVLSGH